MKELYRIGECTSSEEWNAFVRKHGTVHHLFEWSLVNRHTFGCRCVNFGCWRDDQLVAIYPYIIRGKFPIRWYVSPTDFGGGPVGEQSGAKMLIAEVEKRARKQLITMNVVRYAQEDPGFLNDAKYKKVERCNLVIDLKLSKEEIWKAFPRKLRNSIRKSHSQGLEVVEGTVEDLDVYLDLVNKHSAKVSYRPRSERFIRAVFKYLDTSLFLVKWKGELVGGCVYVNFNKRANAINAARDPEKQKLRIGEANHWGAITHYCKKGYESYDFMSRNDNQIESGAVSVSPTHVNLHRFKTHWKPEEIRNVDLERIYFQSGLTVRKFLAGLRDRSVWLRQRLKPQKN